MSVTYITLNLHQLKYVKECNLPISKLIAITTDGAPSITGRNNGFLALCAKDE
jgi:hypothetical protein